MTSLSVVMVNRARTPAVPAEALRALGRELVGGDEIVWVDCTGSTLPEVDAAGVSVCTVPADSHAGRGRCNALGLAAASGALVAFTDSTTLVQPGWRAALAEGATGHAVVGGPVLPAGRKRRRDWAGFLVDYAAHAVPPYRSATGDVSGNNVAYHRESLPGDATELWKAQVNAGLRAQGAPPFVVPAMQVHSRRTYSWQDLLVGRVRSGALYSAGRCATWSGPRRGAAAAGCLALPAVALLRTARGLTGDPHLSRQLARSVPMVIAANIAWAIGEAAGYLSRRGEGTDVW